jgi:hypothetical protein
MLAVRERDLKFGHAARAALENPEFAEHIGPDFARWAARRRASPLQLIASPVGEGGENE